MRRSYRSAEFTPGRVHTLKRGRRVSVVIPARDEESTIGAIVASIRRHLMESVAVVDELVVIDDHSDDATATVAAAAGATVHHAGSVLADYPAGGKGQAMWRGVHVTSGDVVVFCDADISGFDPAFVTGLAGPLLARDDVAFCKGFYERPVGGGPAGGGAATGGRVTELMARPLISVLFPHLADVAQPLSGECAGRRDVLEAIPFVGGYGVDLGLLVDVTAGFGNAALVQCDLGERVHRNRPLTELGPQALVILQTALLRAGLADVDLPWTTPLLRPDAEPAKVQLVELPPLADVPADRKTA